MLLGGIFNDVKKSEPLKSRGQTVGVADVSDVYLVCDRSARLGGESWYHQSHS